MLLSQLVFLYTHASEPRGATLLFSGFHQHVHLEAIRHFALIPEHGLEHAGVEHVDRYEAWHHLLPH